MFKTTGIMYLILYMVLYPIWICLIGVFNLPDRIADFITEIRKQLFITQEKREDL